MMKINKTHVEISGDVATALTEIVVGVIQVADLISDASGKPLKESAAWVMSKVAAGVRVGITESKK